MKNSNQTRKDARQCVSTPVLDVKKCQAVLTTNTERSVSMQTAGNDLIRLAETAGIDEAVAEALRHYIADCNSEVKQLHENRRAFTDFLASLQKRFTSLENAIDPKKAESPAYRCGEILRNHLAKKAEEARREAERLQRNFEMSERRVAKMTDAEKRAEAASRATARRTAGLARLQSEAVEMELIPEAVEIDGYIEILKFWWENKGKALGDDELRRVFHPMLMYAKQQARKGVRIDAPGVVYREIPVVGKAA